MTDLFTVTCPSCFEAFPIPAPAPEELPTELDYDCEVCCRPMMVDIDESGAYARSHDDM